MQSNQASTTSRAAVAAEAADRYREVRRAGEPGGQEDVEAGPGDVVVGRQLAGRQRHGDIHGPRHHHHREQREHRAHPPDEAGLIDQDRVLGLSRGLDEVIELAHQMLGIQVRFHASLSRGQPTTMCPDMVTGLPLGQHLGRSQPYVAP